jgi:hypothetical protein
MNLTVSVVYSVTVADNSDLSSFEMETAVAAVPSSHIHLTSFHLVRKEHSLLLRECSISNATMCPENVTIWCRPKSRPVLPSSTPSRFIARWFGNHCQTLSNSSRKVWLHFKVRPKRQVFAIPSNFSCFLALISSDLRIYDVFQ